MQGEYPVKAKKKKKNWSDAQVSKGHQGLRANCQKLEERSRADFPSKTSERTNPVNISVSDRTVRQ
jgi:hypothetical protein